MQLEIRDIGKRFGKKQVLRGASFLAEGGAAVGLVGENGSGKSTLLRILAGVLRPDAGSFRLDGRELFSARGELSRQVAYVPQGTPLAGELSAYDNLRLWYDRAALEQSLKNGVLAELGVGEFLRTRADRLSGGMKKRLVIGCAMAPVPGSCCWMNPPLRWTRQPRRGSWNMSAGFAWRGAPRSSPPMIRKNWRCAGKGTCSGTDGFVRMTSGTA